ncbi:MAG TPA: hypothetical protein VF200_12150 [Woeseiaceae bacterium]
MAGLTALFGSQREKSQDSDKLLHLYWNRAELKKEFAGLRKEQYRLKDKIRQQEGATARLQQKLDHLEALLLDPEWCVNILVFYQLRSLALRCQRKLARFAEQLKQQRERRHHNALLLQWNEDRERRRQAVEHKLAGYRERLTGLEAEVEAEKQRLMSMSGFLKLFRRRSVTAVLDRLAEQVQEARDGEALLLDRLAEIAAEKPPEIQGLDLAAKRSINLSILSFAQQLYLTFGDEELAALAKEACDKSAGAIRYGSRNECERLLERIRGRVKAMDESPDVAEVLQQRAKLIGQSAMFGSERDAVPVAGTVATLFDIRADGQVTKSEANLLGENYWAIAKVLSR